VKGGQKKYSFGNGKREATVGSQHGHLREQGKFPGPAAYESLSSYSSFKKSPSSEYGFGSAPRHDQGKLKGNYAPGPAAYRIPTTVGHAGP
jgi:hypothetical protein